MKRFETYLKENHIPFVKNQSMAQLTSFKLGGTVDFFVMPSTYEQLKTLLQLLKQYDYPFFVLGNGTNVLFKDKPSVKVVLSLCKMPKILYHEGLDVHVSANVNLFELHKYLKDNGLGGLEFAFGIPGSVGGAIKGNAGAFCKNICDFVKKITVLNEKTLKISQILKKMIKSQYRQTSIDGIVLSATFSLEQSDFVTVSMAQNDFLQKRLQSQPTAPSAGSIFKRENDIIPSKLIDEAGLKGLQIGGAKVSEKHAGFIVKASENCTSEDVIKLIKNVKKIIKNRYNIDLKQEILII